MPQLGAPVLFPRRLLRGEKNPPAVRGDTYYVGGLCGVCLRAGHKALGCNLPRPRGYEGVHPMQLLSELAQGLTEWQRQRYGH